MATSPKASTIQWTPPSCPTSVMRRSKKFRPPPATPNRLGSCVMMMVSPAPALKPTRMLSLIRRTSMLSRNIHAIRQRVATATAVKLAICAYRTASPAASAPTVAAIISEIAEVGPTASCRDEPSSA